jgi:hypothetical protein
MTNILTPEEKKYLRFFCKYLLSYGEDIATFRLEDYYDNYFDGRNSRLYTEENYYLEIPEKIRPIFKKISEASSNNIPNIEEDYNSVWANFIVDTKEQSISVEYCYSYYSKDEQPMSWDEVEVNEDEDLLKVFEDIEKVLGVEEVRVQFDGNGDSGSIEGATDGDGDGVELISSVENWCYEQLESNFGGWEINEGSSGEFVFKTTPKSVDFDFAWNNENTECDTIFEEKFDN